MEAERGPGRAGRRRFGLWALGVALVLLLAFDLARAPAEQLSARALLAGIDAYQERLSPRLAGAGVRCRFAPSCSRYAEAVIAEDGAFVGGTRAAWRIMRCGPWTAAGTHDPP